MDQSIVVALRGLILTCNQDYDYSLLPFSIPSRTTSPSDFNQGLMLNVPVNFKPQSAPIINRIVLVYTYSASIYDRPRWIQ